MPPSQSQSVDDKSNYNLASTRMASLKRQKIINIGKDVKNLELLCIVSENIKCFKHENSTAVPQKLKTRIMI